jgi:AcrR family transcriptional regulator
MGRPNLTDQRRRSWIPQLARVFAEHGYRRTTTAELADACETQETVLYRLWPDKKAMFLAAVDHVFELSRDTWETILGAEDEGGTAAERLLSYEAEHLGEFGLYRLLFAGLSESDDPEIRAKLVRVYRNFHRFISQQISAHRESKSAEGPSHLPEEQLSAWALIGLGTIATLGKELRLFSNKDRRQLLLDAGSHILG